MTREEYMTKLQKYLRKLPKQDYEDAIEYFNEYFSDTDEEGQQRLMEELGTPKEAAADLMYNLLDRKIQEQDESGEEKKSKKGITLLAVLAIMSTPVTVPLFIAMLAVLLAAAICVVCVIFSDFIVAFSITGGWQAVAQRTCFLPVFFIGCTDDHRMWVTWNWMRNPAVSSWNLSLQMDWYASCYACTENSWKEG